MKTYNIFKPEFTYDPEDPEGYRAGMDRFGPRIGASRLGATIYELPAGQALCPYHYESDEEWIVVLQGAVSVRHPDGVDVLAPGDTAAFPSGPTGAHKVFNASAEPVRLMMFSTRDEPAYAVYPDSNKVGVWTGRSEEHVLARMGEGLEYFDGEL